MTNMTQAATLEDFCDEIAYCCEKLQEYYHSVTTLDALPADRKQYAMAAPRMPAPQEVPYEPQEALIADQPLIVRMLYPQTVAYMPGQENRFAVRLINPTDTVLEGEFSLGTSQNVHCTPRSFRYRLEPHAQAQFPFTVEKPLCKVRINVNQVVLFFVTNGIRWSCRCGFPDARVYHVENLDTGEKYDVNVPGSAFTVPARTLPLHPQLQAGGHAGDPPFAQWQGPHDRHPERRKADRTRGRSTVCAGLPPRLLQQGNPQAGAQCADHRL